MYNLCSPVKSRFVWLGVFVLLSLAAPTWAAWTWDGGSTVDGLLTTAENWNPDGVFDTSNSSSNGDSLVTFDGNVRTSPLVPDGATLTFNGITFAAGAAPFTFELQGATGGILLGRTNASTTRSLTNSSSNAQTFNVPMGGGRVDINAANADIIFNQSYGVANASSTSYLTQLIGGTNAIYLNGGITGQSAVTDSDNGLVRIVSGTTYITAASTSTDTGNNGGYWNGRIQITNGILRISDDKALGAGYAESDISGNSAGRTTIGTSATPGTGRLELVGDGDGSISSSDRMVLWNRAGSYATVPAHIKNVNGSNILTGQIINGGGAVGDSVVIEAADDGIGAAELLTLGDAMAPRTISGNLTGGSKLVLRGNGAGWINHSIEDNTPITRFWDLYKLDSGTWTIANGANTYSGKTVIEGGTLALSNTGSIATTPSIEVKTGATFDVSAVSGWTFAASTPQTLGGTGTVKGNVQNGYGGATMTPGTIGTAGTLTIDGNLSLFGTGTLQFDLNNNNTTGNDLIEVGGNLTLNSGLTINASKINGDLIPGNYPLIHYTGSYSHDWAFPSTIASSVNLTGLSGGLSRQTYTLKDNLANQIYLSVDGAPLNLTWAGNGTNNNWDVVTTQDWNSGAQMFYNGDYVTFTNSGSISPPVNLVGDLNPGSVTVDSTSNYIFSGFGAIVGAGGLTKNGSGKLTIDNGGPNTFSGAINLNAGTLEIGTGGFSGSLGAGAIALAASTTLAFNRSDDLTLANVLSGTGTLEQKGAGVLILSNANTAFTGPVLVSAGTLKLTSSLGTTTVLPDVTDNALLQLGGTSNVTFTRRITGTGSVDKVDANTILLISDINDYTGSTRVSSGTLSVGNGGTTGALGGTGDITLGPATLDATGTLRFNRLGTVDISRNIVGTGLTTNAVQYGTADNVLLKDVVYNVSGNNAYSGDTLVYEGTVVLSTATGLGDAVGKTTIAGGAYAFATVALTNNITVAENITISGRSHADLTTSGYIPNIANLSGSNTLSGIINNAGGGSIYTISSLGTGTSDLLTISGTLESTLTSSRSISLRGPGKGEVTGTTGTGITGTWTSVSITGGTWTFKNANPYTCATNISANSKLVLSGDGSIANSSVIDLVDSTAILDLTLSTPPFLPAQTLTMPSTQSLIGKGTVQGSVATTAYSNVIAPSTKLDYSYNQLGGTMTITGDLTLAAGYESMIFKLSDTTADPKNDKISLGGALKLDGTWLTQISIIPNTTLAAGDTYTLLTSTNEWTNAGLGGGFQWDSLNNKTRYTFDINTFTPKTLKVTVLTDDHATLTWSGTDESQPGVWNVISAPNWTGGPIDNQFYQADAVNFTNDSSVNTVTIAEAVAPASITVNNDASHNYTFSGTGRITGGTGINKSGAGTLTLGTAGEYNGVLNITGGTVIIGNVTALGSNDVGTEVSSGGTLDLNGFYNIRREPISVAGLGVGDSGALVNNRAVQSTGIDPHLYYVTLTDDATVGGSNNWTILGPVQAMSGWTHGYLHGNGHALTKVGASYLTLDNLGETGLGDIFLTGGRIYLQGDTTLGNSSVNRLYLSNGTLFGLWDSTVTHAKPVTVDATGGRIHVYTGTSTFTSDVVTHGTFTVSSVIDTTLTLNGPISGAGGLRKTSAGKVVLAGDNTYEGETLISEGILELAPMGQISALSAITNDAVLQVNGGAHALGTINGAGTMNVLGDSVVTATSISQDTLTIGGSAVALNAVVPEPGTWTLLLIGLLAAACLRRFRSR